MCTCNVMETLPTGRNAHKLKTGSKEGYVRSMLWEHLPLAETHIDRRQASRRQPTDVCALQAKRWLPLSVGASRCNKIINPCIHTIERRTVLEWSYSTVEIPMGSFSSSSLVSPTLALTPSPLLPPPSRHLSSTAFHLGTCGRPKGKFRGPENRWYAPQETKPWLSCCSYTQP